MKTAPLIFISSLSRFQRRAILAGESPHPMKLLSRSGLTSALCLATLLPLVSITAAPTKKSSPQPKPEPALEAEFSINPQELSPASTIEDHDSELPVGPFSRSFHTVLPVFNS